MIVLRNVSKSFDGGVTFAVCDFSVEVQEGETLVLLGSSGCGKTTTLKMINRIIEPTEGTIEVDGVNVREQNVIELRRSIGYVFQRIGLFPHITIEENVTIVPRMLGWSPEKQRQRAKELLELVRLDPALYANRYPHELSGGQQQRVGVARALAADPAYLLMDEPFGALDPLTREQIQEEFVQLEAIIQKTLVFVTHDVFEAVTLGDRIAIMKAGKIVQVGSPAQLLLQPVDEFVRDFFGKHRFQLQFDALSVEQFMRPYEASQGDSPPDFSVPPVFEVIDPDQAASDVLARLEDRPEEAVFVIDKKRKFHGIIDRDAVEENPNASVTTLASEQSFSAPIAENLGKAVERMRQHHLSDLPVVDGEGRLVGVLRHLDLADALVGK